MKSCLLVLALLCCGGFLSAAEKSKPNILLLFADDMRADTIAAHGNLHIKTPNLDKLGGGGFQLPRQTTCSAATAGPSTCRAGRC